MVLVFLKMPLLSSFNVTKYIRCTPPYSVFHNDPKALLNCSRSSTFPPVYYISLCPVINISQLESS